MCTRGTAVQGRGTQGMAPPASKLANGDICAYPSNPGSSAQASTSAASLNLLHFAMKYVLCAVVDKYSEKNQKLTYKRTHPVPQSGTQKGSSFSDFTVKKSQLCL